MTQIPPAEPQEESLGALVAAASDQISTLVRAEIELAKSELSFNAKRVGMAAGLLGAAAFMAHLVLILASFTLAYALVALHVWTWLAFAIVTVFYLVVAGLLAFIGIRKFKGLPGMPRTLRSLKTIKSGESESVAAPAPPTAGQVGTHREPMRQDR
ncbi:phage holin family protein [Streptosporangium sp. NBC_01756]|uniref:phage holin family protein n=1 Tax=Streptosporangium sp. NBC_01756 TaxID=2975950 RepID=UPI002DDB1EAA|nr:phage holin family protein [Streptosporangium sp. NBC_01756]WSC82965.1 phage holin family protein [Streptosporangium sp. NBC_01756]